MKLTNKLIIFFTSLIIFSILYYLSNNNLSYIDSLTISANFQTFNGSDILEFNNILKTISIIQMIFSYILIVIILYGFSK
jgi:hypothetical protein